MEEGIKDDNKSSKQRSSFLEQQQQPQTPTTNRRTTSENNKQQQQQKTNENNNSDQSNSTTTNSISISTPTSPTMNNNQNNNIPLSRSPPPSLLKAKSAGELKKSLLEKIDMKRLVPVPVSVVVYDFDDTLFPTSHLALTFGRDPRTLCPKIDIIPKSGKDLLSALEEKVVKLLLTALASTKHVFIVTNGSDWWIKQACSRCMPKVMALLDRIPIVSAKDLYQGEHPTDVWAWKIRAFLDIRNAFEREKSTVKMYNIVSVGDSPYEQEASLAVANVFPNAITKIVNFIEKPTLWDIATQVDILTDKLKAIVDRAEDLTMQFQLRQSVVNSPPPAHQNLHQKYTKKTHVPDGESVTNNKLSWKMNILFEKRFSFRSSASYKVNDVEFSSNVPSTVRDALEDLVSLWREGPSSSSTNNNGSAGSPPSPVNIINGNGSQLLSNESLLSQSNRSINDV